MAKRLALIAAVVGVGSLLIVDAPAQTRVQAPAADSGRPLITRDPATLSFPRNYWDPVLRANLLLLEFIKTDWEKRIVLPPPPNGKKVYEEISYLHSLVTLRTERQEEIKAQADYSFLPFFFPLLMMHQYSHPATYEMANFAYGLGPLVFYYKARFNRARPSQLAPDLAPMIVVPGHPAYPSGHAFQSWLVALVLAEIRPDAREPLMEMATRIGMNREIAGVHYPSDSNAGRDLARQVFDLAKGGKLFQEHLAEAKVEWR